LHGSIKAHCWKRKIEKNKIEQQETKGTLIGKVSGNINVVVRRTVTSKWGLKSASVAYKLKRRCYNLIVLLTNSKQVKKCFWFSYVVSCDFYVSSVNSDMVFDVDWRMLILIYALIFLF
jgi:hypothetical protein